MCCVCLVFVYVCFVCVSVGARAGGAAGQVPATTIYVLLIPLCVCVGAGAGGAAGQVPAAVQA